MKTLTVLIFSLVSSTALAAAWTPIESNAEETLLIDPASLRIDGDDVEVKVLRTYANVQLNLLDGEWYAFRSQVATYMVECKEGTLGYVDWVLHHGTQGKGRAVHKGKVLGVLAGDPPANHAERVLVTSVCSSDVAMMLVDKVAQDGK